MTPNRNAPADIAIHPAPEGSARRWATSFIAAFVLALLLIPLRWYLGGEDADERFCWRIYSPASLQTNRVVVYESVDVDGQLVDRRVPLAFMTGEGWRPIYYSHYQPTAIRRILQWRCDRAPVQSVRLERTGFWPDGTPITPTQLIVECDRRTTNVR